MLVALAQLESHLNPLIILPSYNPYFESRDEPDHAVEDIQPDSPLKTFRTIQVLGPQRFSQPETACKIKFKWYPQDLTPHRQTDLPRLQAIRYYKTY